MIIGIIGLGWVGASVAISTLHRGIARELWLHDAREGLAEAEAADFSHGASFYAPCDVRTATVAEMAEHCDAIVIAAGQGVMPGKNRLDALAVTAKLATSIGAQLRSAKGVVVVVTNPVDVMTALLVQASGLPATRVLGTGTMLDTARLRWLLGNRLAIDDRSVHAQVLGEHGDSSVVAWSSGSVGGLPLRSMPGWNTEAESALATRVRRAAYEIIAAKGATNHAIGLVTASLLQAIVRDERRILTVSTLQTPAGALAECLGGSPVALSLPTVVGRSGAGDVLLPPLDEGERLALRHSADVLRAAWADAPR
jgi:L-lactate dehydrogenase